MAIPGFGDAILLFDVSVRIINFVNDLRHAQDDLLGLHAEANTLRICINSVTSDSCHDALYLYITEDQGRDLRTIVETCDNNLRDLNRFIGSCAALVEKKGRRDGLWQQRGVWQQRKSWPGGLRRLFAKAWAAYKFTMSDKQAFRDKLVLPTQAVNVFLTSMTHVGLANVGMLMMRGGAYPFPQPPGGSGGQGTRDPSGGGGGVSGGMVGWDVVGKRIAFTNTGFMRQRHLTIDVEEEVLLYIKHLLKGGDKFSYILEKGQKKFRVTKAPLTKPKPRARSRSRSKSRPPQERLGPLGMGKSKKGSMYVLRKKSASKPAAESTALVRREWQSGSDSEGPDGRLLSLPAAEYIEIKPSKSSNDGSEGGSDDDRRGGGRGGGGGRSGPRRGGSDDSDHGNHGGGHGDNESIIAIEVPDVPPTTHDRRESRRTRSRFESRATFHNSRVTDLEDYRRQLEDTIEREQEEAISMLERAEEPSRLRRQSHLREDTRLTEQERDDIDEDYEIVDTMRYLDMTYGVIVTPAGNRPEVDNGGIDSETEEVHYDDDMLRTDRLRAETTLPTMPPDPEGLHRREASYHYMPRSTFERSRSQPMYDRFRYMNEPYMPYPRSPLGSEYGEESDRREYDPDSRKSRPDHPRNSYDDFEERRYQRQRPRDGDYELHTEIKPIIKKAEPKGKESRRSTYHDDHSEDEHEVRYRERQAAADEERRMVDEERKRKSGRRREEEERDIHIVGDHPGELRRRPTYEDDERTTRDAPRRSRERERYEKRRVEIEGYDHDDHDGYYMRGARGNESDDEDREGYMVRR